MRLECGYRTDIGRVRETNEDSGYAGEHVWVVADGMGGHAAGDVASALVVEQVATLDTLASRTVADVVRAVEAANHAILAYGSANPTSRGLGSTVTGVADIVVDGGPRWAVFNVGDSRVYHLAEGTLRQVTVDHSEVDELVRDGVLTPEQARVHPGRHVITRSLGSRGMPEVDVWLRPQRPGERFLLCSDGLNGEITDDEIARLASEGDPEQAAGRLVDAALAAGGHDNVTVLVLDVHDDEEDA